jgi:phenylacetate-CoA ligase
VFTTLTREALPVIRYRTRDLTRLLPPTARSMRRMAKVVGRSDDMLIIRGVNVFPSQIEEIILSIPALGPHYVLEVTRAAHLDAITIHAECADGVELQAVAARTERELVQKVKSYIGIAAEVRIASRGSIERWTGKAKHVIDGRSLRGS